MVILGLSVFFFNDTATTEIYTYSHTLSLHDALPIYSACEQLLRLEAAAATVLDPSTRAVIPAFQPHRPMLSLRTDDDPVWTLGHDVMGPLDRKSTRLNSSH